MRSLLELMDVHGGLHEKFAVHRDLVVGLEFGTALAALEDFERALRAHMDDEERHILPLYERRVGHVTGGDPQFFWLEHKNLLRNLDTMKEALRPLAADPKAGRRQAHEFLQKQSLFLQILEHHELREKNILYPQLDAAVSDVEREAILSQCGGPA